MFLLIFVLAVIVSMPIVAIVVVSMASKREDRVGSLGGPAQGVVQSMARRVLDFHSDIYWTPTTGALIKANGPALTGPEQLREDADDSPILVRASALAIRPAA